MATKSVYVVTIALIAVLIVSATSGAYYYYEYQQATQSKNEYESELVAANSDYQKLVSNYDASLSLYNETFSLLTSTIAEVNTSQPVYAQVSSELTTLWDRYLSLKPASASLFETDILIDFGNGTSRWYNGTQVQPDWNLYIATVVLSKGDVQAQWYPAGYFGPGTPGEHFVTGIDGVSNSQTSYWWLWTYNSTASWQLAPVGPDLLPVYNGSVFAWTYCGQTPSYAPACSP